MKEKYIKLSDAKKAIEDYRSELTMSKYGSLEACMDAKFAVTGAMKELDYIPTADVVPKSEIVNILDGLMKEAREIADRYEKSANETSDYDYARIEYRGCQMGALLVLFKIAELKKKYTEEQV